MPLCEPSTEEAGRLIIGVDANTDGLDTSYELTVVESTPAVLIMQEDPAADLPDERHLDLDLGGHLASSVTQPAIGDPVVVSGGECEIHGYARVADAQGEVLLEAGNPWCATGAEGYRWGVAPYLGMRPAADPSRCRSPEPGEPDDCCCVTAVDWEILLRVDGGEEVLPVGDPREVTIDGRQFLAQALYAAELFNGPCTRDLHFVAGSAYLAPLDE